MKILIAEDDPTFRHLLEETLARWGYEVIVARDGNEAWGALRGGAPPRLAILDWLMPGVDGPELCRKVRKEVQEPYTYIILLTSQQKEEDLVVGMEAGADDYITKPLKTNELRVRLNAGRRIVELQHALAAHAADLEAANRDLESFSYAIAHDLLKSLLSIGEYAKSIQDMYCSKQDEQCRSYTRRIYEKTRHLGQMIGIMHDFFSPTRIELHWETIDLSAMAVNTVESLRKTNPERRITSLIAEGVMANGDANQLQVVMENLVGNAWKHTRTCDEAIIEFGVTEAEGKPAYFVRDNGTGFDLAHADQLFKPFRRLPGTEEFEGQGVGLARMERIVRRHGGKVWAEGEPGKGATFYFTLGSATTA
jgi:two-component system sensor histidine kinase/response regulator